jgi:hypothetical protein
MGVHLKKAMNGPSSMRSRETLNRDGISRGANLPRPLYNAR